MANEVFAFLGGYAACDGPEGLPECLDAALSHFPKQSLQFGKYLFDGVEIETIGGQEQQGCAGGLNGLTHCGLLVGGQIVHHDDVAGLQRRHSGDIWSTHMEPYINPVRQNSDRDGAPGAGPRGGTNIQLAAAGECARN
jgi:hypothetical protein